MLLSLEAWPPLRRTGAIALLTLSAALAGCGGGDGDSGTEPPDAGGSPPPGGGTPTPPPPGGGTPTPPPVAIDPPTVADAPQRAAALAASLVGATTPAAAVAATAESLAIGGVALADAGATQRAPLAPAASWTIDPALAFNLAAEAHARAVSGRVSVDELARMWADFGFPFAGEGTPGEQLLGFLREWLAQARAEPAVASGFVPALIAELAARQLPAVDLADPALAPSELRLTLLEIELLHAAFDRQFQPGAAQATSLVRRRPLAADPCSAMKDAFNTIAGKLGKGGLALGQEVWGEAALKAIGLTPDQIKAYEAYGEVLSALDNTLKVVKLVQIYASAQVMLEVQGPNPVRKPQRGDARVLVPVKASAGVPEADWRDYQRNNSSQAYQTLKSCLGQAGMPMPLDLKDIAEKVGDWRVSWKLLSGSPQHAFVSTDVNVFDASFAGNPFAMKLQRSSPVAAEATLKVDIEEEPPLATLFQGPLVTANVRVKAEVLTAEPPSPELLTQVTNLIGTVGALVDLSVGWIQTMFPPATTTTVRVQYHDLPASLQASYSISMTFDEPVIRGSKPQIRHTIAGSGQGSLKRGTLRAGPDDAMDFYGGTVGFTYSDLSSTWIGEDDGCSHEFSYKLRHGDFQLFAGPRLLMKGDEVVYDAEAPMQVNFTGDEVPSTRWPAEQQTHTIRCDKTYPQVVTMPMNHVVFVPAANALNLIDAKLMSLGPNSATVPGWDMRNARLLSDGTLELRRMTPATVTVLAADGGKTIAFDTVIRSVDSMILLKPTFDPPPR